MDVAVRQRNVHPRLKLKHNPRILGTRDVAECRSVMDDIQQVGQPVAIDAEGIRLGEKGRMTLLQICTWDGRTYLLDLIDREYPDHLYFGKKLLISGWVKAMLESKAVEEVGCNTSSFNFLKSHRCVKYLEYMYACKVLCYIISGKPPFM